MLEITGELKWREVGKMKDPPLEPGEYDAPSVVRICPLIFNFKKFTERVLIAVCISPMPASSAFSLKNDGKSIKLL